MRIHTRGCHRMMTETNKTTNFQARFIAFLYWLANLRTY